MRRLHFVLLLSLVATRSFAQNQQNAPRAIQLPDTMGANFSVSDSATATSLATDYDFLIGVWEFRFQSRRRDGSFTPPFNGHWFFNKKETADKGVLIEDH